MTRLPHALIFTAGIACKPPPEQVEGHHSDTGDRDTAIEAPADTDEPAAPEVRRHDCGGIEPADIGPFGNRIALTFDDGPSAEHTATIVDELQRRRIPATFFQLGIRLSDAATWDLVEEMVADPLFNLANHSWDHSDMTGLSARAREAQVEDTTALLGQFGVTPRFFRFPYGNSTCRAHDDVTASGLHVAGWHIDTGDWCYAALGDPGVCEADDYRRIPAEYESDMIGFVLEQAHRYGGGTVLLHDIHAWTAATLPSLIDALEAEGFTFVALEDDGVFPNLNEGTPADIPYLGESCLLTRDTCFYAEYYAWCEPTSEDLGVCTMPCEGYCGDRDGAATTFCAELSQGAGQCTSRALGINEQCMTVPGTLPRTLARHVGSSGAPAITAEVCAPADW